MAKAKCFDTYFLQKGVKFVEIDFHMFSDCLKNCKPFINGFLTRIFPKI